MPDPRQPQFWNDEQRNLWSALASIIMDAYYSGAQGGIESLPADIQPLVDFNLVNQSALDFAKDYRYSWIKDITDTTMQQTQQAITNWMQSGAPLSDLEDALSPIYGDNRASLIAATETTRAYSQGNLDAWESSGVVSGGVWMTSKDERVCPICHSHDGETVGIGDMDAAPPNSSHPGCRCWLKPIVSNDMVGDKIAKALR